MALREIRTMGDPILEKKSKQVTAITERIRELIDDMVDTLVEADGVGLAAVQVGVLKRIIIIDVDEEETNPIVMINPVIKETSGEQDGYEGCLSVPGKTGMVTRPDHVVVEFMNEDMEPVTMEGDGIFARCVCHECDHLEGELYVDKVEGELRDVEKEEEED